MKNRVKCLRTIKERPELYHREKDRLEKLVIDTQARIDRMTTEFENVDSLIDEQTIRLRAVTKKIKLIKHAKKIEALKKATEKLVELSQGETL